MKIALISCSKSKKEYTCEARELYSESTLFDYSYKYAKKHADKIYVLSAKHGLIGENEIISPYELTLKTMTSEQKAQWSKRVLGQLQSEFDIEEDEFIILAGSEYYINLIPKIKYYTLPLGKRTFGERMSFLKNKIVYEESDCAILHRIFNSSKRYSYDEIKEIPYENGIYLVFEKDEFYKEYDRIVRVGTHDSQDRLKARLKNHFINENKDGSIFRKNIGLALLNKRKDDYKNTWVLGTSKEENKCKVDYDRQKEIEKEVTEFLRSNFTFTCFQVDDKELRLRLEKGIISTLNNCEDFRPCNEWVGRYHPNSKISESGLWLKIGLDHDGLNHEEMDFIYKSLNGAKNLNTPKVVKMKTDFKNIKSRNIKDSNISTEKTTTKDIYNHILNTFNIARQNGKKEVILVSGDIHRVLGLNSKMPSVCSAMYQAMSEGDEILATTPSGKSSTIKIKYYL